MIRIANAPCSWGALEFDLEGEAAGFAQVLDEMQQTGYAGTELGDWGFMPTDPAELKTQLDARNLSMVGAFLPAALSDTSQHALAVDKALQIAGLMHDAGFPGAFIVLADDNGKDPTRTNNAGRVTPEMGLSEEQWNNFASGSEKLARAVRDRYGLKTVFHHHCSGFVETPHEVDTLMNKTDPELLGLCIDAGHLRFAGGDPLQALKKYGNRVWHFHFKDCHPEVAAASRAEGWDYFRSVNEGVFCELGKGEIDFQAIVDVFIQRGFEGWFTVEQDVLPRMGNPKVCARRNRGFIRSLGL